MYRKCTACGAPVSPSARFCSQCGEALDSFAARSPEGAPSDLTERRLVTVLFADLVGFTARSEHQDPEDVASFLNEYFDRSREVIDCYGGMVEKFAGDAVMAVWGAHVATEDDAERAVRAGLELLNAVAKLAAEVGDPGIMLRVGIHTGEAAVRSVGTESAAMVVGDLVNSAARLQVWPTPERCWSARPPIGPRSMRLHSKRPALRTSRANGSPSRHGGRCESSPSGAAAVGSKVSILPSLAANQSSNSSKTCWLE